MKLYWGPHTFLIGNHIPLEEVGAHYRTEKHYVGEARKDSCNCKIHTGG